MMWLILLTTVGGLAVAGLCFIIAGVWYVEINGKGKD